MLIDKEKQIAASQAAADNIEKGLTDAQRHTAATQAVGDIARERAFSYFSDPESLSRGSAIESTRKEIIEVVQSQEFRDAYGDYELVAMPDNPDVLQFRNPNMVGQRNEITVDLVAVERAGRDKRYRDALEVAVDRGQHTPSAVAVTMSQYNYVPPEVSRMISGAVNDLSMNADLRERQAIGELGGDPSGPTSGFNEWMQAYEQWSAIDGVDSNMASRVFENRDQERVMDAFHFMVDEMQGATDPERAYIQLLNRVNKLREGGVSIAGFAEELDDKFRQRILEGRVPNDLRAEARKNYFLLSYLHDDMTQEEIFDTAMRMAEYRSSYVGGHRLHHGDVPFDVNIRDLQTLFGSESGNTGTMTRWLQTGTGPRELYKNADDAQLENIALGNVSWSHVEGSKGKRWLLHVDTEAGMPAVIYEFNWRDLPLGFKPTTSAETWEERTGFASEEGLMDMDAQRRRQLREQMEMGIIEAERQFGTPLQRFPASPQPFGGPYD